MQEEKNNIIKKYYFDVRFGLTTNPKQLYDKIKKEFPDIKLKDVKDFMTNFKYKQRTQKVDKSL